MGETNYAGIDYGMGTTNLNKETGIRFGVISCAELAEWACEEFDSDYGDPSCPKCGNTVEDSSGIEEELFVDSPRDYYCQHCNETYWSELCFPEEPLGWVLDADGYKAILDEHNEIFLTESPYYTHAQFCSPCAPGAGHLEHPCKDGPKTFCFGHDWFEGDKAPYPVYKVEDGTEVPPE